MNTRTARAATALAAALLTGVCTKNDNPGSPSPPQCRTFASQFTRQVVKTDYTTPQETSRCTFDSATATLTCSGPYTYRADCPGTLTSTEVWASVSDFVVESDAVGKMLLTEQREMGNYSSSCGGNGTGTVKLGYDSSRRLGSRSATGPSGSFINAVYSSWDDRGRPTAGMVTSSDNPAPCRLTATYDDQRRTYQTTVACADTGVEIVSLDTNGNIVRMQTTRNGTAVSTETRAINGTQMVCR